MCSTTQHLLCIPNLSHMYNVPVQCTYAMYMYLYAMYIHVYIHVHVHCRYVYTGSRINTLEQLKALPKALMWSKQEANPL